MTISKELLDELLKGVERPEDLLGDAGLMKELKIKLMERMLGAELTAHLGYEEGKDAPPGQPNRRNGTSTKVLKGQDGELPVAVPRDRDSSFEPELVKKGQTRIDGMDDKIVGLYAAGLTVRDIQAHLLDLYGLKVSPDLISRGEAEKKSIQWGLLKKLGVADSIALTCLGGGHVGSEGRGSTGAVRCGRFAIFCPRTMCSFVSTGSST
jgi:hypothetical protein